MAQVEFKFDNIRRHGFPYACLFCSSDEEPHKEELTIQGWTGGWRRALGCFLLFFGPLGWLFAALLAFVRHRAGGKGAPEKLEVPVCENCSLARRSINNRLIILLLVSGVLIATGVTNETIYNSSAALGWVQVISALLFFFALADFGWLSRQFRHKTITIRDDRVIIDLPNDDYPSLYQRHLDTASLYGAIESLGTQAEEPLKF